MANSLVRPVQGRPAQWGVEADMNRGTETVEQQIRDAATGGNHQSAAALAFEAFGAEILSFLSARLRSQSSGEEVLSMFAEDLWAGITRFEFRCSVRGWLYVLARNAANRYAVSPPNRAARHVALSSEGVASALIERERTATQSHLRTDVKDSVRALRESLDVEDQTLLILHIDRGLPWRELAMVMHQDGESLDDQQLSREAARLRKRFERVKAELRELAVKTGLVES
ncbi:MAG: hypothetical protein RLZZ450_4148 [Pseudomonadota bacterium]|jgi:DNA-directed RNA polymerase specialized sigma24 family protein